MPVQVPQLKRGFFGYRTKIVRLLLTGHQTMYTKLWERLGRTEAELAQSRGDVEAGRLQIEALAERARSADEERLRQLELTETARARVTELEGELDTLRSRIRDLESRAAEGATSTGDSEGAGSEDLSAVLASAERAFAGMIDRARRRNGEQLARVEAARWKLRDEMDRLGAWRTAIEGLMGSVRGVVANARARIREAPDRLRAALTPTTDAVVSVDDALVELADATERLPGSTGSEELPGRGGALSVRIPEASGGNGAVDPEDLAAIQEQYSSP